MKLTLLITGIIIFDAALAATIIWTVLRLIWRPMERNWPAIEPAPDAVRRNFQSFRFGASNFGGCIHVAADESHLHLIPARFLQWFGIGPISVPRPPTMTQMMVSAAL